MTPKVREDGRYEVTRTLKSGEERRLPDWKRDLVLRRDRVQCVWCGSKGRLEIDHIIPWSAGGSDDFDNLRTLCHDCNQERSNYANEGDLEPPRFPTAHECVYCNKELLGDPEVQAVYCIHCNKRAPGLPIVEQPRPNPFKGLPDEFWEVNDEAGERIDAMADAARSAAVEHIRRALAKASNEEAVNG